MAIGLIVLTVISLVGLGWVNYRLASQGVGGEDFIVYWIAIRSLVTQGTSPYSEQVSRQVLATVSIDSYSRSGMVPQFTFPLYAGIIIFPFALINNFVWAQTLWMTAQEIALAILILLAVKLAGVRPGRVVFTVLVCCTVFSFHGWVPLLRGNMAIWIALIIPLALAALQAERMELAGSLLAFAMIQPNISILFVIFVLIWAYSKKKPLLFFWFLGSTISLSVIGLFLVPNWLLQYIRILWQQSMFFPPGTPGEAFSLWYKGIGSRLGWAVTGLLALILVIECWLAMRKEYRWFYWTASLMLVISSLIGIPTSPLNFVVLTTPLVLCVVTWDARWKYIGRWIAIISMLALFIWEWSLFFGDQVAPSVLGYLNLLFPLPLIALIGLYWVRWWATRQRRMLIEELRTVE